LDDFFLEVTDFDDLTPDNADASKERLLLLNDLLPIEECEQQLL
jgi:hypothetical protein